jgi:protein-tyrosine phosphatase
MKILIVCLGNICRSPMAEGILQEKAKKAGLGWQVDSAGTNGYHTGESPHRHSIKVSALNGIDISNQRSRRFTPKDISEYDLIYAMAEDVLEEMKRIAGAAFDDKKVKLFLQEQYPDDPMDVPDPWYGEEDGYHETFRIINTNCDHIINRFTR